MLLDEYILLALETQFNNQKEQDLQNLLDKYMKNAEATFTASPSSCFLANRNKASTPNEQHVKNESLGEHAYMSMSTNQNPALEAKGVLYQGSDTSGFTAAGGQTDFCQISGPLMTPPISPAALVHRSSVINQGPMAGRPLSSSSSSSCLSSLGVMTQPSACPSYPESLYQCSSYFPSDSSSSAPNGQTALRPQSLAAAQSQAPSASCHFPGHSSLNEQQLTRNMFYSPHSAAVALPSSGTSCSLTPYSSAVRPSSSYTPSSESLQPEQGLDPQTAAQMLDSAAGFSFVGAGLNLAGGCQAQAYSGHNEHPA